MQGSSTAIAFKVEFLGLDMTSRNRYDNPQQGAYITSGELEPIPMHSLIFLH